MWSRARARSHASQERRRQGMLKGEAHWATSAGQVRRGPEAEVAPTFEEAIFECKRYHLIRVTLLKRRLLIKQPTE